jgi:hypothetical protein
VSHVRGTRVGAGPAAGATLVKGSQKPKKLQKKQAQKSLKERRAEKRAAAKQNRYEL